MRLAVTILALALAVPARAQGTYPPLPAPPAPPERPETIAEAPVAPAGSQAAPLHPDEAVSHWRAAIATGIAGKAGGRRITSDRANRNVLLYFSGQADGLWTQGLGQAARLRLRLFTGGESDVYVPSDGDAEAAYLLGPREFRFVIGRVEVARYPALAIEALAQAGTLPCFEGSLSLASDTMRLYYFVAPIEAAWVRYGGGAHILSVPGWTKEDDRPSAATAGRLRYTILLPASVLLSLQGDLLKLWAKDDLLASLEGSLGMQALRNAAAFNVALRWNGYTRRGLAKDTSEHESELLLLGVATLAF